LCLAAGLFNKLNFIWFINSFFLAAAVVYWQDWKSILSIKQPKGKYSYVLMIALCYVFLAGYFFLIAYLNKFYHAIHIISFPARIASVYQNLKDLTDGQLFYNYVFGSLSLIVANYFWIFIVILIMAGFIINIISIFLKKNIVEKHYWFYSLLLLLQLFQIVLTKDATAGWHVFSTYPFILVLLCYSIYHLCEMIHLDSIRWLAGLGIITIIFSYNLFIDTKYIEAYSHPPKNIYWSPAIYDLIQYTQKSKYKFVSVDWGTHNQLVTFYGAPGKYVELAFWLNRNLNDKDRNWLKETFLNPDNNYLFIMYPSETIYINWVCNSRSNLFASALKYKKRLCF
jgi:hypothetical protein